MRAQVVEKQIISTPTVDSPLIDVDTVAAVLGVTRRHVQRLVAERRIPFLRVGRFIRFERASLDAWLDMQRVEPQCHKPHQRQVWR